MLIVNILMITMWKTLILNIKLTCSFLSFYNNNSIATQECPSDNDVKNIDTQHKIDIRIFSVYDDNFFTTQE